MFDIYASNALNIMLMNRRGIFSDQASNQITRLEFLSFCELGVSVVAALSS